LKSVQPAAKIDAPPVAIGVAFSMWRFWQKHGHLAEARRRLESMEAAPWSHDDPRLRAKLLEALGGTCWWQGEVLEMSHRYKEALSIWQSLGDEAELANAYYNASFIFAFGPGQHPDADSDPDKVALSYLERARDLFHRLEVISLVRSPHLDDDARAGLGDPAGLAQRRDDVVGEEERVEAGDQVEGVIVVGKCLHVADPQIGVRQA